MGARRTHSGHSAQDVERLPAATQAAGRDPQSHATVLLYLDQNYLSGIVKRKAAFRELEPTLRTAVARGAVAVPESETHRLESAARPDLPLLELLRQLSAGLTLPHDLGPLERHCERRLGAVLERDFPERRTGASDRFDIRALAVALPRCRLVTCDAFMADVVRRTRLDVRFHCELFSGRRADVARLNKRLERLPSRATATASRYPRRQRYTPRAPGHGATPSSASGTASWAPTTSAPSARNERARRRPSSRCNSSA
jgi:hypothetical protein